MKRFHLQKRMMLTTFRFGSNEKHIREALTAAFKRRGVDLAELDASIRSIMVAAAFSTGVEEQVEAFTRLARVAETSSTYRTTFGESWR